MTLVTIPFAADATSDERNDVTLRVWSLASSLVRPCLLDWQNGAVAFEPDLTAQEQAAVDRIVALCLPGVSLTPTEFDGIRAMLPELRTFRTRPLAQWNALTAAQREADEIAWLRDLTDVLRAMLRDR